MLDKLSRSPKDVQELAFTWPLCFEFNLSNWSTVIVAGAYKGKLMDLLVRLYPGITIHGFEPQAWAIQKAYERNMPIGGENGITFLHPYGIGISDAQLEMGEFETDAASFVNLGVRQQGYGQMREFCSVMEEQEIGSIDLAIFNMEGYEFILLPYLLENGWIDKIDRLAVQWHLNLGAGSRQDMDTSISKIQERGHKLVYDHRPQWSYTENWKLWESKK